MIRINMAADLEDMFGGQTDFEVSITMTGPGPDDFDIIGAGHTLAEAVTEARAQFRTWRGACTACGADLDPAFEWPTGSHDYCHRPGVAW